ncbi:diguanylate cyclase domain-containing protein [Aestuariirhabdus sp. LZHN29]|uniref:sensor domain-containing diguanylate cyclase n=1 Tax=Aestuariirhabdus sp. LZHN29 TaxID=3417462 RepID=UPI003CEAFAF3
MTQGGLFLSLSLRSRLLLVMALALALLLPLSHHFAHELIFPSFVSLEKQRLKSDRDALDSSLALRVNSVRSTALDWAQWDDTYEFIAGKNDAYIEDNLEINSLANLDVNGLIYLDLSGRVVHSINIDLEKMSLRPLPVSLLRYLKSGALFFEEGKPRAISGLLAVDGLLVALAAEPVTDSNQNSASNGVLLVLRFLDRSVLQETERLVGTPFELVWDSHPLMSAANIEQLAALDAEEAQYRVVEGEGQGSLSYRLEDITAKPLLVRISRELSIMAEGAYALERFQWVILTVVSSVMVLLTLIINQGPLARLRKLQASVHHIGVDASAEIVELPGQDELAQLARDFSWTVERLRTGFERQQVLMDQLIDGFVELDLEGHVRVANLSMARMLGVERENLIGAHYNALMPAAVSKLISGYLQWVARDPAVTSREVLEISRSNGEVLFIEVSASAILSGKGKVKGVRSVVRDVTHRQQEHMELSHMAYHDPLTGLFNRKALGNEIEDLLRQRHYRPVTLGVLYLDLDHFKRVNDTLGHQAGDQLLQQIAHRLLASMRENDFIARVGGDEFVVLLQRGDTKHFEVVAEKLVDSIRQPYMVDGNHIDYLGVSVGISLCPEHSELPEELIHLADRAMYMAKQRRATYEVYQHSPL